MLSQRAEKYLKVLQRVPAIPTQTVEKILLEQGYPCFPPWLDFHEKYAGYVEPIGHDTAIWGIAHHQSYWIGPYQVSINRELYEEIWYITCAEVHPSYEYQLDQKGEFLGNSSESFHIKVEQNAAFWEFCTAGKPHLLGQKEKQDVAFLLRFRQEITDYFVFEASDKYHRCYMNNTYFAVEDVEEKEFIYIYQHA